MELVLIEKRRQPDDDRYICVAEALEIQFIEVSTAYRRQRITTDIARRLMAAYPDRRLVAFANEQCRVHAVGSGQAGTVTKHRGGVAAASRIDTLSTISSATSTTKNMSAAGPYGRPASV